MNNTYPIYADVDVVICGGGTAGTFAAIAAAERGKSVLVLEQFGSLGGSATNGLVTPVMHTHIQSDPQCSYIQKKLNGKLEFYSAVAADGRAFDPLVLRIVLEELCLEAGVRILYHTCIAGVEVDDGKVTAVRIVNKGGEQLVRGRVFIDATGDGDVSVMAGADYTKGNPETGKCQPMSLRFLVGGVNIPAAGEFVNAEAARSGKGGVFYDPAYPPSFYAAITTNGEFALGELFDRGIESGELVIEDRMYWQAFTVPGRPDAIAFNCPEFFDNIDGTDPEHLTEAQIAGKRAIFRQMAFLRRHFPGFEGAYVTEIASMVGVRQSRNIVTEYVLCARDLVSQRKFDDMFCQSNYPIDIHGKKLNCSFDSIELDPKHPWYDIPYRALVVKGLDNLLVVGRCIGAEFVVQSSLRVQHSCRSSGEAAGIAAALAIDADVPMRRIDGAAVRAIMEANGAVYERTD